MQEIICPSCQGKGGSVAHFNMGSQPHVWKWQDCYSCNGNKVVDQATVDQLDLGIKLVIYRRCRNLSQRELAKELGICFMELSKIENGRIAMPDSIKKLIGETTTQQPSDWQERCSSAVEGE